MISLSISPLLHPYIAQAQDRGVCHIAAASRLRDPVEIFDIPFSSSADLGKGRSGGSDKGERHATLSGAPIPSYLDPCCSEREPRGNPPPLKPPHPLSREVVGLPIFVCLPSCALGILGVRGIAGAVDGGSSPRYRCLNVVAFDPDACRHD